MADLTARLRTVKRRPVQTGKSIVAQVKEDDIPFMAGSIAYQAFASLVPLLLLLFVAVAAVGDEALAQQVVRLTEGFLPNAAQKLVSDAITGDGAAGPSASIVGIVVLVWGSLKIFRGLDKAFSEIYETDEANDFLDQLHDGVIVLVALGISIPAMVGATSLFAAANGLLLRVLNLLVLVMGLTVAFLPMFRYFPDAHVSWEEAVPGALFAAVGWTVLQFLFQLYLAVSSNAKASSAIGAILLLLTWLYLSGLVLLLGAVVNAVLLGDGGPAPKTGEDLHARIDDLEARLADERERRRALAAERDRLDRELEIERTEETAADAELAELRRRNHLLRQRLQWEEKSLLVRIGLRLVGVTPPRSPEVASRVTSPAGRVGGPRGTGGDAD